VKRFARWSEFERWLLRQVYPSLGLAVAARILGRTIGATGYQAHALRLRSINPHQRGSRMLRDSAKLRTFRRLHAAGWSDAEIAQRLGVDRHAVCDLRHQLGMPSNAYSARRRRRVARQTRMQLRRAGLRSLAELRIKAHREFARRSGWPEDLRFRAVQILNALWERGPMTRMEIAAATGMPWKGAKGSLASNDPEGSYLAHLMKRGLVVCVPRCVGGRGRGRNVSVYTLPMTISRRTPA
jgi:hypothetical protein